MAMVVRTLFFVSFALFVFSCSNNGVEPIPGDIAYAPPTVGPIYITTYGPIPLAFWQPGPGDQFTPEATAGADSSAHAGLFISPVGRGMIPQQFVVYLPYANPARDSVLFPIDFPVESAVDAWISVAVPPRPSGSGSSAAMNGVRGAHPAIIAELHTVLDAGPNVLEWDGLDNAGNPMPAGYYRCVIRVGGKDFGHDFAFYRNPAELPAGLAEEMKKVGM